MFTYLKVKNYKSLVDFQADFRNKKGTPKKLILIYGENGAGKSNLIEIFHFLKRLINTRVAVSQYGLETIGDNSIYNKKVEEKIRESFFQYYDISTMIGISKTFNSQEPLYIECGVRLGKTDYSYIISMDDKEIIYEKLSCNIKSGSEVLFEIVKNRALLNNAIKNKKYETEIKEQIEKYWGKHSFLSLITYEYQDKIREYVLKNIDKNLLVFIDFFMIYNVIVPLVPYEPRGISLSQSHFIIDIFDGDISIALEHILDRTEKVLNSVITSLYSDIKQVYYRRKYENNNISYKLYCKRNIYGKIIDIEFVFESYGTRKLFNIIPFVFSSVYNGQMIMDEFDTGIHDILIGKLLENIEPHIKGQLIITTHNTALMESEIKKDNIYVFNISSKGDKELIPITDFEKRIHPNLNVRKRYLSGLYGGVPYSMDIDFDEIDDIMSGGNEKENA